MVYKSVGLRLQKWETIAVPLTKMFEEYRDHLMACFPLRALMTTSSRFDNRTLPFSRLPLCLQYTNQTAVEKCTPL